MSGLPPALAIAIWLVGALWAVGMTAFYFNFDSDLMWLLLCVGTGTAVVELKVIRDRQRK